MNRIDACSISFNDLFLAEDNSLLEKYTSPRLIIPAFQRNYAWDRKHVKELIDSINDNNQNYYIGNILIQDSRKQDLIIDGQQRITTILLIIKILSNHASLSSENKQIASEIFFYRKKILRVEFTRENLNKIFKAIILGDLVSIDINQLDDNAKKIIKNFYFIDKEILKISDINIFFKKVIDLIFVVIKFTEGFNVNQLFEGLNSKGKQLSTVQLTKNALLGSSISHDDATIVVKLWEEMESMYEKKKAIWFDKFLRHFSFFRYGLVTEKTVFKKLKQDIKKSNVTEFSFELKNDSDLYFKIRTNTLLKEDISSTMSDNDWNIVLSIIKNISYSGLEQVYAVIFACIKYAKNNHDYRKGANSRLTRDLKKVWSFATLAKYLVIKPSKFENSFASFSLNLGKNKYKSNEMVFKDLISTISGSSAQKFSDNINKRIKITGENTKNITSDTNRSYISQLLFCYLTGGRKFVSEDCTIEHIIPKGKESGLDNWKVGKKYISDVSNISRYKLGNLTLLSGGDELGNLSFNEKLTRYLEDDFKKNNELMSFQKLFNSNNPAVAVSKRGEKIAKELYDILLNKILIS